MQVKCVKPISVNVGWDRNKNGGVRNELTLRRHKQTKEATHDGRIERMVRRFPSFHPTKSCVSFAFVCTKFLVGWPSRDPLLARLTPHFPPMSNVQ